MADLKCEILEKFGVLSTSKSGWNLELNFVQWGDSVPKFDLRSWSPDHKKMGKGLTLTHDDLVALNGLTNQILATEKTGAVNKPAEPFVAVEQDSDDDFGVLRRL